jgi:chromate transport protein ChrA
METEQIQNGALQRSPLFRVSHAVGSATILAIACLLSYFLITTVLTREYSLSREDDLLGGMWTVVATIFVYRTSYQKSTRAAVARTVATLISFIACFAYLLVFPFHVVGMVTLIGIIPIIWRWFADPKTSSRQPLQLLSSWASPALARRMPGYSQFCAASTRLLGLWLESQPHGSASDWV